MKGFVRHGIRPLILAAALVSALVQPAGSAGIRVGVNNVTPAACYAPGTPWSYVESLRSQALDHFVLTSLAEFPAEVGLKYQLGGTWSSTATDGAGIQQGDPITLTWSIVPDGTPIPAQYPDSGETAAGSSLISFLNGIYGSEATWLAIFDRVFARWSAFGGITYVFEPNDDGLDINSAAGEPGVRGDIRIGGHYIDGNSGILAYNWYPNSGDMVIDVPDSFYNDTSNDSLKLRNTLAHEHGHGLGMRHVCPVNQTKLMEPFLTTAFDGPQHDDILAVNRGYGDPYENNDAASPGAATALGAVPVMTVSDLSIDDNLDEDFFAFDIGGSAEITATLSPVGETYLQGPQITCSTGTSFDSLNIHDLSLELQDAGGNVLHTADVNGGGLAETISNLLILEGAGTYYLRVAGDSTNDVQLYELAVEVVSNDACGGEMVDLDGMVFSGGQPEFSCSASQLLILRNNDIQTGAVLSVSAPVVQVLQGVSIAEGATVSISATAMP